MIRDDETKEKIRRALLGRSHSESAKLQMRLRKLGTKKTEDHRKKIGDSLRAYHKKQREINKGPMI